MYQQYDRAVQSVLEYLTDNGYSRTPTKDFQRASREFRAFLAVSNHVHSQAVEDAWLCSLEHKVPRMRYLASRRALALIDQVITYGFVKHTHFSYGISNKKYQVPVRFQKHLQSYLRQRKEDGCETSTLCMDRNACSRFLIFLDSQGITTLALITPEITKAYAVQEEHRTVEGKIAYIRRTRGFIRFLASRGIVPNALEFAFPVEKANRVSIVKTLTSEQIAAVEAYRKSASTPSTLRNAAMAMLALHLGLRSIDICCLRLSDIDWCSTTVSIIQRKTGKPLTLPFSTAVGNALSGYILHGRPKCDSQYVFITLKHPFQQLSCRSGCYKSSIAILGGKDYANEVRGLHIARKTFASRLLKENTPVSLIAQALGHSDETTVDEYLATDVQRMRACSIGLTGIELFGALR